MEIDRIYEDQHRQLSRIATYAAVFSRVPLILMLIGLAVFLGLFIAFGHWRLGVTIAIVFSLGLLLYLFAKSRLDCPKCEKPFFGKFTFFGPYRDRCENCGFCIIPGHAIELDGKDM